MEFEDLKKGAKLLEQHTDLKQLKSSLIDGSVIFVGSVRLDHRVPLHIYEEIHLSLGKQIDEFIEKTEKAIKEL